MMPILLEIARIKKKMLLMMAVLLLLNSGMYAYLNFYLAPDIKGLQMKWNELRRKVTISGHLNVDAIYKQGKADLNKLAGRILSKQEFPIILGEILDTAASNNVKSGNISYKPEMVKEQNLQAYGITMSVTGTYAGVKSFLADMLVFEEMVVIDSLSITQHDPTTEDVTMGLHLTVYMREGA